MYFVSFSFRRRRRRCRRSFPPFYLRPAGRGDPILPSASVRPSVYLVTERRPTTDRIFLLLRCDSDLHSLGVTAASAGWEGEGKALEEAEQNVKLQLRLECGIVFHICHATKNRYVSKLAQRSLCLPDHVCQWGGPLGQIYVTMRVGGSAALQWLVVFLAWAGAGGVSR